MSRLSLLLALRLLVLLPALLMRLPSVSAQQQQEEAAVLVADDSDSSSAAEQRQQQFGPVEILVGGGGGNGGGNGIGEKEEEDNVDDVVEDVGWSDGVCYHPIQHVRPGDSLLFEYGGHDVQRMASQQHLENCNFTDAVLLSPVGSSPYLYTVSDQDARDGEIYFSCSIGSHCSGGMQKLTVRVNRALAVELIEERINPISEYRLGVSSWEACLAYQTGNSTLADEEANFIRDNALQSECTDPVQLDNGRYFVSCLSGPATLTPGGVLNSARIMHYPYPKDRRAVVGTRTWEFVEGDPIPNSGGMGVIPVPVNQLYIHHLAGGIILGQGAEGIRRSDVDAPFPAPYGSLTGDEGDLMIFHIIDLRQVDEWLECVECRCRDPNDGTYLDIGGSGDGQTGGVDCCTNCTTLTGPTVDYRMRYNVSYYDIPQGDSITNVQMITADISPAVGKSIEFDVPSFRNILPGNAKATDPKVQRLERVGPFADLFQMEFFGAKYGDAGGPSTVKLLRCVGHLHIAAIGMWLEDADTGEMICSGVGTHGTGPEDKGFLTAIEVANYDPPLVFPSNRNVRLITEYNATELHTGVMGMWFAFVDSEVQVTSDTALLRVDFCEDEMCDVSYLPYMEDVEAAASVCKDELPNTPACRFGNLCSCEDFVNAEESTGCGGVYKSSFGDIQVDLVCARYCDACNRVCADTLSSSPICSFGNICTCEEFVNAEESTGCGGVYRSDFGDVDVDTYCTAYCGSCPEGDDAETMAIARQFVDQIEEDLVAKCVFATAECNRTLTNLYSCGAGSRRTDNLNLIGAEAVRKHGKRLALKHAKLGASNIHRDDEEFMVPRCSELKSVNPKEDSNNNIFLVIGVFIAIVVIGLIAVKAFIDCCRRKAQCCFREQKEESKKLADMSTEVLDLT